MDWDEFRALAAQGNAAGDRGPLRAALDLVRGKPLTGLYWHWVDTVLIETMRDAIAGAAAQLAGLELAAGDPAAARRAARTGLAVRVEAEPLWRALMRAEDAEGSTAGVHAAYRSCLAAVSAVAPGAAPHRETAALYRDLARRPPGGPGRSPGSTAAGTRHDAGRRPPGTGGSAARGEAGNLPVPACAPPLAAAAPAAAAAPRPRPAPAAPRRAPRGRPCAGAPGRQLPAAEQDDADGRPRPRPRRRARPGGSRPALAGQRGPAAAGGGSADRGDRRPGGRRVAGAGRRPGTGPGAGPPGDGRAADHRRRPAGRAGQRGGDRVPGPVFPARPGDGPRTAAASLPAGSLLAAADIGAPAPPRGQAQLGVALKPGRYPPGLSPGQHVEVLATGPGGARPAGQGIVLSPGTPPRGAAGQAVVELQLPQQELPQVAAAAAAGQVTLAAVPADGGTR